MNMLPNEAIACIEELSPLVKNTENEVILCVPYTDLFYSLLTAQGTNIKIGAQNMHFEEKGAFTGEVSGQMLKSIGVEYVIIGHSERRQYFAETDETVNKKIKAALANDLKPIVCVGETLEQREAGKAEEVFTTQTRLAFEGLSPEDAIYSITKEGNAYNYAIIDPNTYRKIFSESNKNGKIQHKYINLDDIEFIDYLGLKYKESNYNDLIKQIKLNRNPFIFCEYDENINMLTSSVVYIDLYHNKAKNEDILVILDKPKHPKKRIQKPLFIIILDISGSMFEYQSYLQNNIIPKLLNKLGYIPKYNQLSKIIKDDTKNIPHFEILQAITSRYILKHFLEKYDPQKTIDFENFKDYSEDIIPLITFSDDSQLYFYNIYDFEKCDLSGT